MCRVHSLLTFLHVCVKELASLSICSSCETDVALCDYLVSLMHWLFPLCAGGLLDHCPLSLMSWLVSCQVRVSGHPMRVCACWVLSAHHLSWPCMPGTLFPFAIRVMLMLMPIFSFPLCCLYDWVLPVLRSQISLLFSLLSLGVYRGVFLYYLGMPIPRYLPSKKKKLRTHLKLSTMSIK